MRRPRSCEAPSGSRGGEPARLDSFALHTSDGTVAEARERQGDCTFELVVPEGVAEATVVASGRGWHLEEHVVIPSLGDPPAVCLNPPCRTDPLEGTASVRIIVEGAPPEESIGGNIETTTHAVGGRSCWGSGDCTVTAVAVGEPITVSATSDGCYISPRQLVPVAGLNEVRLACRRLRTVQGIIRGPLPEALEVHCGESRRTLPKTRLFQLACPADAPTLEVQVGAEASARRVAIPPGDPALVEIPL